MRKHFTLAALLLLAAGGFAQTVSVPKGLLTTEGAASRHVPLRYNPARIQCGYGPKATGWTKPRPVFELHVRADSTGYLNIGFSVDCRVILSSQGCDPECTSYKFDQNHGTDRLTWMARKKYSFSPFVKGTAPAPFNIILKGDRPFFAVHPTFLVDWTTYAAANQANTSFYIDADRVSGATSGTKGRAVAYGTACNPANFDAGAMGFNQGELLRTYCYTRNLGDTVLAWIGRTRANTPLPWSGCTLLTAPILLNPQVLKTTATATPLYFDWGKLPTGIFGARLCAQFAAVDASMQGIRMSKGVEITVGNYASTYPYMISHRYGYGSGSTTFDPDKDDARYGWINTAIIFKVP